MQEYNIYEINKELDNEEIVLVEEDYNSTKFNFIFSSYKDAIKKIQLKLPDNTTWEKELDENDSVVLVGEKNGELVPILTMPGTYFFDIAFYGADSKITTTTTSSFYVRRNIKGEDVSLDDRVPILDDLINDVSAAITEANQALSEANNLDIDITKVDDTATITITKKDGETKSESVSDGKDGVDGVDGKDAKINGVNTLTIEAGTNIGIEQEGSTLTIENTYDDSEILSDISDLQENKIDKDVNNLTYYTTTNDMNTAISDAVGTETTNRQNADINLQGQIDAITASSDVVDIVATYTDLQNYDTSSLTADDVIKVMQDSTHSDALSYYRWVITGGTGAWEYIGSEGPFYTKSETDTLLNDKVGFTDYATDSKGGVIKTAQQSHGNYCDTNGILKATNFSYSNYASKSDNCFIGKGTLENVITGKGLVKDTDYATSSKGGTIKVSTNYNIDLGSSGLLYALEKTYAQYNSSAGVSFISKGTLENVIAGKELTNKTDLDKKLDTKDSVSMFSNAVYGEVSTPSKNFEINSAYSYFGRKLLQDKLEYDLQLLGESTQYSTTGKNLLPNTASSQTQAGVTFTINKDKSITINGTATIDTGFNVCADGELNLDAGTYILSSKNTIPSSVWFTFRNNGTDVAAITNNSSGNFTLAEASQSARAYIYISSGVAINNLTIYPMIRLSSVTDDTYEPYTGGIPAPNPDYPQEIESISGYNLFIPTLIEETIVNNVKCTPNRDGTFTLNGTASADGRFNISSTSSKLYFTLQELGFSLNEKGFLSGCPAGGSSSYPTSSYKLFMSGQNGASNINDNGSGSVIDINSSNYNGAYYMSIDFASGTVFNNLIFKPMITKGTQALPYRPYGCIGIDSEDINKFDKNSTVLSTANITSYTYENGVYTIVPNGTGNPQVILNVDIPSGAYTLNSSTSLGDATILRHDTTSLKNFANSYTAQNFTLTDNANNMIFNWTNPGNTNPFKLDLNTLQIVKGTYTSSTMPEYVPYVKSTSYIKLLHDMRSIDTVRDRIYWENGKWYDKQNILKIVLDGTVGGYNSEDNWYYMGVGALGIQPKTLDLLSNYFTNLSYSDFTSASQPEGMCFITSSGTITHILIRVSGLSSMETYRAWLAEHLPEVYYIASTPVITQITDTATIEALESIRTYTGLTEITSDIDITGSYVQDLNKVLKEAGTVQDVKVNNVSVVTNKVANITVPTKTSDLTNDSNFAKTNENNNFSTAQTINGTLTVNGDISQTGTQYETHAEQLYTKKDLIKTRDGAVGGLGNNEVTGIEALLYDGTNNGRLVFDNTGTARVGDVGDEVSLLARDESANMSDGKLLAWDANTLTAKTTVALVTLTQEEYDALQTKDSDAFYYIV